MSFNCFDYIEFSLIPERSIKHNEFLINLLTFHNIEFYEESTDYHNKQYTKYLCKKKEMCWAICLNQTAYLKYIAYCRVMFPNKNLVSMYLSQALLFLPHTILGR